MDQAGGGAAPPLTGVRGADHDKEDIERQHQERAKAAEQQRVAQETMQAVQAMKEMGNTPMAGPGGGNPNLLGALQEAISGGVGEAAP